MGGATKVGLSSPSGLLEESLETSKSKRLERVTSKQKNDREKLLQEKRRQNNSNEQKKEQPQANPMSKFKSMFRVDSLNPKHKRKESSDDVDLLLDNNNN